jgi:hypothetical protein
MLRTVKTVLFSLQTRSSRTVSEHESYDSYEDDFDDTYLKTKEVEAES